MLCRAPLGIGEHSRPRATFPWGSAFPWARYQAMRAARRAGHPPRGAGTRRGRLAPAAGLGGTRLWQILAVQSEYCKAAPCVYIHVYTCTHKHTHARVHAQAHAHACTHMHICAHACMCSHVHTQMHSHARSYVHTGASVHTYMHAGTLTAPCPCTGIHAPTCTHAHPRNPPRTLPGPALPPGLGDRAMPRTGQQSIRGDLGPGSPGAGFPPVPGRCRPHPSERGPLLAPVPCRSRASSGTSQQQTVKDIIQAQRKLFS